MNAPSLDRRDVLLLTAIAVVFGIRDRASLVVGALFGLVFWVAA